MTATPDFAGGVHVGKNDLGVPVVAQRQSPMVQTVQKTNEIPQLQFIDTVVDNPVVQVPRAQVVEQILHVLVPEMVKQSMEVPKTNSQDRIQQQTLEQIVNTPVPQAVEELAEASKVFSQDRVQQRFRGQIIEPPAISLAEKIVKMPVTQVREETKQVVNTHVQHVVSAVEAEMPKIIKETVQRKKAIINEKINQVTKHVEIPQMQTVEKTAEAPHGSRRFRTLKPLRVWALHLSVKWHRRDMWRWSSLERLFLQNPLHPYPSQLLSWKMLQLLLSLYNPFPLQSTWRTHAQSRTHMELLLASARLQLIPLLARLQ